jgi:uncharacterized protein YndB with AHSA1/START domain
MKFRSEIIINKPVKDVFQYTVNPKKLFLWVDGFEKFKPLSGKVRQVGSIATHIYNDKEGKLEVREEVLALESGKSLTTHLSHKNMETTLNFRFLDQGNSTKIIVETRVRLKPLLFNLASPFVKTPMKKQQQADLNRLKNRLEPQKKKPVANANR